jgi:hypothetical protein
LKKPARVFAVASTVLAGCVAALAPAAVANAAAPTAAVRTAGPKVVWVDAKVSKAWPVRAALKQVDKYTGTKFKIGKCRTGAECITIREKREKASWAGVTYVAGTKSKILLNPSQRHKSYQVKRAILVHELGHARGVYKHTHSCTSVMYYSTHCPGGSVSPMTFTKAEKKILHRH